MAGPTTRRPVAVLGATGVAGRQALAALARHPWFEVAAVAGSADSAGKRLGDVLAERAGTERRAADLIAAPRTEAQRAAEARGLPAALLDLRLADSATLDVRAMAHITGGGIAGNLGRPLPAGLGAEIDLSSWERPAVFTWLASLGVDEDEMRRVFNLGLGYACVVADDSVELALRTLERAGMPAWVAVHLVEGDGVNLR